MKSPTNIFRLSKLNFILRYEINNFFKSDISEWNEIIKMTPS
jgi:hypothetical protein